MAQPPGVAGAPPAFGIGGTPPGDPPGRRRATLRRNGVSLPPPVLSRGGRAAVDAAATVSILVWGATPVATKIAVNHIDPVLVGVARTVIGGAVALPIVLVMGIPLPRTARQIKLLALSAFCGFVAFTILFSIGQSRTSATHTGLIFASIPIFTGIFAFLMERRGPSVFWWVGGAIALAGEAYIILFRGGDDGGGATLAGDAMVLVATIIVCLGYVIGARLTQIGYSAWGATFWGVVLAALAQAPLLPFVAAGSGWQDADMAGWWAVLYLALGSGIVSYVCWYWALGRGGIAKTGMLYFYSPLVTIGLAVILLGETLTPPVLGAAAAIFAGVYISQRD